MFRLHIKVKAGTSLLIRQMINCIHPIFGPSKLPVPLRILLLLNGHPFSLHQILLSAIMSSCFFRMVQKENISQEIISFHHLNFNRMRISQLEFILWLTAIPIGMDMTHMIAYTIAYDMPHIHNKFYISRISPRENQNSIRNPSF